MLSFCLSVSNCNFLYSFSVIIFSKQIVSFVDRWLYRRMPHVRRWQYDDNSGERSIDLFHVHVFIETAPFQYAPREGMLYIPPHAMPPVVAGESDRHGAEDGVAV